MPSPFSPIMDGTLHVPMLLENDKFFSFLEQSPLKEGHAIVAPKKEVDALFDLDEETLAELWVFAKKVAAGIKKTLPCDKIGALVYGLKVRHAHIHLIPIDGTPGEIDFSKAKPADPAELAYLTHKIKVNIEKLLSHK